MTDFFIQRVSSEYLHFYFKIVCPMGAPSLPHLLRCRVFAVVYYNFILCALHLRKTRRLQNSGIMYNNREKFYKQRTKKDFV
jgi:hypothetical protein